MRLRKNAKIDLIKGVPLFSHCSRGQLAALAAEADELDVAEGTALTREGEPGREFVVIVEGSVDVTRHGRRLARLGAGDFLGEIALISGAPRTATVTTTSAARILVLTDRAFKRVTREMPAINASLVKALSERLQADTV
ncbi:MAG TPA: cyclic nucleotide-binding domain-containing protein [Gaiellaceae bacterium]|jgi:CRP-like cAMP-binding protein